MLRIKKHDWFVKNNRRNHILKEKVLKPIVVKIIHRNIFDPHQIQKRVIQN